MAVNSGFTALNGAAMCELTNRLKVYTAVVDVTKLTGAALADGDWVALFTVPAGSTFIMGQSEILTVDAGGGAFNIDNATSSTHVYHTAATLSAALVAIMDHTMVQAADQSATTVYMWGDTAALTTLKVRITMLMLENSGAPAQA
jgi:hypothetical protein